MKLSFVLTLAILLPENENAKILMVFPIPARSHFSLGNTLALDLVRRGHEITMISPFEEKNSPKNYHAITTHKIMEVSDENVAFDVFTFTRMNTVEFYLFLNNVGVGLVEECLSHPQVQNLLKSNASFDLIIMDQSFTDALKVFSYHYKAPLILFTAFGSTSWINAQIGNAAPPSLVAEQMIYFSHRIFTDRLKNFALYIFQILNQHLLYYPSQDKVMHKYFPDAPYITNFIYNASLVLLNSNWATNEIVPRQPNMIDIGGFHIKRPSKLPEDLQNYLDGSRNGVIYFSMGSLVSCSKLSPQKLDIFLKTFAKIKQNVLWKCDKDTLTGKPDNVATFKWLPQQDILAHPNVKLMINHGGLLSVMESVYNGVPLLMIPTGGDTLTNANFIADNKMGRYLLFNDISENSLEEAINDLLRDKSYRDNAQLRSYIMRDPEINHLDRVEYWIKYVIKHQGAAHLRSGALDLSWYQYLCIDCIIFLLISCLICYHIIKYVLLCFLRIVPIRSIWQTNKIKEN